MNSSGLLVELYRRVPPLVRGVVDGLTAEELRWAPPLGTNSIGWLVWHLTRVQDHHVSEILDIEQVWSGGDHAIRIGLPPDPLETGYGHNLTQVEAVRPISPAVLLDYLAEVDARTRSFISDLSPSDLDRVVDDSWDPPVTMGVRLISIADDSLQHVGQAAYVRGLLGRR